jgi:hypothetical protein
LITPFLADLRFGWGTYKPAYFVVKLSTLLIVAVLDTDNCLFLGVNDYVVSMVRQALLVVAMTTFFVIHSFLTPFIDPVNNASEWVSRTGYVAFAVLGLIGSLNIPSTVQDAFNGPILYVYVFFLMHLLLALNDCVGYILSIMLSHIVSYPQEFEKGDLIRLQILL